MLLATVVETSREVAGTSKRLRKVEILASLLRQLRPDEVEVVVPFLSGATRQGRIRIGYATLHGAATSVAELPTLEIADVDQTLSAISLVQGSGAERNRRELLQLLLSRATEAEKQFLSALLMGEIRQGALEGIMLDAVSKACSISLDKIRRSAMMAGDIAIVAKAALEHGEAGLHPFDLQLFRPIQPMLAQSAEDAAEAIEELGAAALEYKMDGARVQVHRSGDRVVVFSRQLNDVTVAVPEIVEAVRSFPGQDLILDGEVLSLDPAGRPRSFQTTMRRFGRKLEVDRLREEIPLRAFWFDLMYLNGGSTIDETQEKRFALLQDLVPPSALIPSTVASTGAEAEAFLQQSLSAGHEGIMAKGPGSLYAAGARGQSWLKIKQARTLDLVILAAEWGHGRRKGWLSNLHLGARDTEKGGFAMLGKTFKGLTDKMLAWQTEELLKLEIARDGYAVHVEPKIVVEVAFNEIQISSRYASGLALRFARVKSYRTDKTSVEADTFATVQKLALQAEGTA